MRFIDNANQNIRLYLRQIDEDIKKLESRHNIIQGGTEFGRVLALRDFKSTDLAEKTQEYYTQLLSDDHCVTSTLILERAEDLLTSEDYINFFADFVLPQGGYFRLVLANEPKHWEGLSAYAIISNRFGYQMTILPMSVWETLIKTTLEDVLPNNIFVGIVELIERNTELGTKVGHLDQLISVSTNTDFAGRIAAKKSTGSDGAARSEIKTPTNIHKFWPDSTDAISGIPVGAVHAYRRLLALIRQKHCMEHFDSKTIEREFRNNYEMLIHDIRRLFQANQ
jgi:hypothetical protein